MRIERDTVKEQFRLFDENGNQAGEIDYRKANDSLIYATHTEVYSGYEGKGYAGILLNALVEWARQEGLKIYAICPYVAGQFEKHPDKYQDVMKKR